MTNRVYNVKEIATYLLYSASRKGISISNLKLQKVLYFLWKDYFAEKNRFIFAEEFSAWKFGPVQTDVYFDYYMYGASPIDDLDFAQFNENVIDKETRDFIDATLDTYHDKTVYDLVEKTHKQGCAWDRVFRQGEGNNDLIPFEYIKEDIRNER